MPISFLLLRTVNATVNVFPMKLNFSEPKIFTGGVDISNWSKLTLPDKKTALEKDWFVYFSFRSPSTGKLTKQPFIKAGVNKLKTKRERYAFLRTMKQALFQLLQYGFNPYEDNSDLEASLFSKEVETNNNSAIKEHQVIKVEKSAIVIPITEDSQTTSEPESTIAEAFKLTLELKVNMMNKNSFIKYKSKVGLFEKWLIENKYYENPISFITKKIVMEYLNSVLTRSSARNRNNSRTDIASMFQLLEDNELVVHNFVSKIPVLNLFQNETKPIRQNRRMIFLNVCKK